MTFQVAKKTPHTLVLGLFFLGMTTIQTANADAPESDLTRGAKDWSENCARCHNMRPPTEFNDSQWKAIVLHMRIRAGLTGHESRSILKFLQNAN